MRRFLCTVLLTAIPVAPLLAQGSLSLQGFGYPTGQASSRAAGTAGALGETDAGSPINPGALPNAGRSLFSFQMDPEFRQITVNGRAVNTTTARFPVISVGSKLGTRGFLGISFSTLLDRTWDASFQDSVTVGGDRVASTVSATVRGAVNDTRLAYAWQFSEKLQAGMAIHAYTGANRMTLQRTFNDSATFGALAQNTTLAYGGSALSMGVVAMPIPHIAVGASLRLGGNMRTRYDDSTATRGNAPTRYGMSLTYDGIPGSQLALRVNHEQWTRMASMGSSSLDVNDVTEVAAGADIAGPKFQSVPTQFRLGARMRDLPFGWNGKVVSERTLAAGAGIPFARGWAALDVSVQRSLRKAGGLSEKGTILSVGLTVRP
ncbi:MAG: hypothetical protein P3B98_02630 [Gemmatimonadota bacterium]|nr:hypothetical protein [Gemmatimonadota bacterium]